MSLSSELKVNAIVKQYDPEDQLATWRVKSGLAKMLKGGVIMDVIDPAQARVAEDAGAVAVMALERVPSDIRHSCVSCAAAARSCTADAQLTSRSRFPPFVSLCFAAAA